MPHEPENIEQAALLAARINHAIELGCHALYTCTGAGDPQHSCQDILKARFREACLKENYAPTKR